jgi:hypothetical protein
VNLLLGYVHAVKRNALKGLLSGQFGGVSVVSKASASTPSRTSADFSAYMAFGGSRHADTINSYPTRAAGFADLCDHAVRLMEWRDWRSGLYRSR